MTQARSRRVWLDIGWNDRDVVGNLRNQTTHFEGWENHTALATGGDSDVALVSHRKHVVLLAMRKHEAFKICVAADISAYIGCDTHTVASRRTFEA